MAKAKSTTKKTQKSSSKSTKKDTKKSPTTTPQVKSNKSALKKSEQKKASRKIIPTVKTKTVKIKTGKTQTSKKVSRIDALKSAYREMLRARIIDDKSITLYKQNKCLFQIGCAGHEAIGVALAHAMIPGKDSFFPYYRDMAVMCALGMTTNELLLNILSKDADPNSGGRQMPMHYGHRELGVISQSSPTGTQFLQAVGVAMGIKYSGGDEVVYVSAGEGTTAQGAYHEALNWAAREKLPVIFVIQDNQFAISVHVSEHIAGSSVEAISKGYDGIEVKRINGLDYEISSKAAHAAVQRARKGQGPSVLIADVVRLQSHSISDNQAKYRDKNDIEKDQKKDPILLLEKKLLKEKLLSKKEILDLKNEIKTEVDTASTWAEDQADPDPSTALDYVLADAYPGTTKEHTPHGNEEFMVDAINKGLHEEMKANDKMVIYGQDVGYGKGGVFSVTAGLTNAFGANRCFNSPLAEDSIVGTAVGLAAVGYKPVVEIQFGDYIWTAMMQIRNELAALYYRSKGQFACPAVVRVAVGGYIRGALYHSQNIEATFSHFPGLVVVYPSNASDAKGLLKSAIRSNDPVIFLEHKGLYRQVYAKGPIGGEDDCTPIGKAKVIREGQDATIITWGALVHRSLSVANEFAEMGKSIEVIDIRTISPLDRQTILESVKKTNKVIIAHEDIGFMGFGAEIAACISEEAFEYLDAPIKRVCADFAMIPQAPALESVILPNKDDIKIALEEILSY